MKEHSQVSYSQAVKKAQQAARRGDREEAQRWAEYAAAAEPEKEAAWMLLGDLAEVEQRVAYYTRALEANSRSREIREQLRKAVRALRQARSQVNQRLEPKIRLGVPFSATIQRKTTLKPSIFLVVIAAALGLAAWGSFSSLTALAERSAGLFPTQTVQSHLASRANLITPTPTPTATATPTPTPTQTPRPTRTPKPPTATPQMVYGHRPGYIGDQEFWLEVDLGTQQMFVQRGDELLRTFLISGGAWATPTVTGSFQIFSKLVSQNMAGPDYYQPNVPHVMYFFEDYSIHGAYWHNDFGTPRSHGCVNLPLEDASWLYQYAKIGTWVIIHY